MPKRKPPRALPTCRPAQTFHADWLKRIIHAVDLEGTEHQSFDVPFFPITFDWLSDGELLVVSGADGELLTLTPAGNFAYVANLAKLSATPWNEVATHGE